MDIVKKTEEKIIDILINRGILTFSFDPPYVFTTGLKSPIYIDNRMLISFPKDRDFIVEALVDLIKTSIDINSIDYISSTLSYAAPFGTLISDKLGLPFVLVHEERRTHGKKNKIEGYLPKNARVLIVEDHISTGAALLDNVLAVREKGGQVNSAVAITDYELKLAKLAIKNAKVSYSVLVKGLPIVEAAVKRGLLDKKEEKDVLGWFEDPIKWGEIRGYYSTTNN